MRTSYKIIIVFAALLGWTNAALAGSDKLSTEQIFAIYDQVNGFDIETAELGVVRGDSTTVRALAAMVLRDHATVRQMARDIAEDENVSYKIDEKSASAIEHGKTLEKLKKLSGAEFDAAYLRRERQFHDTAINAIEQKLSVEAESEALKAHFKAVLPGFRHHLAETVAAMKKLGVE